MEEKIIISQDEIVVNVPIRKDYLIMILVCVTPIIIFVGLVFCLIYIYGDIKPVYYLLPVVLFSTLAYAPVSKGIFWRSIGERSITVDSKYIIVYDKMGIQAVQNVFEIKKISKIYIDFNYKITLWTRIKAFLTRDSGGCIFIDYENKPVRFGYGLSKDEAKELLSLIIKRQYLFKILK
ncbi:MAG: hypothetical protein LBN23_06715 [Paludibacter sp.]|jgi:hypothetical protein|nr:hypothetical protein [Paludibacter sp.]